MIEIYKKLCQLTQKNLHKHDRRGTIHFELPEGLPHSIFCYPVTNLLDIDGTDDFIRECFYKILDRPVDAVSFKKLTFSLRIKKLSRLEVIQEIYNLEERYKKQTDLNYE